MRLSTATVTTLPLVRIIWAVIYNNADSLSKIGNIDSSAVSLDQFYIRTLIFIFLDELIKDIFTIYTNIL